MMHGRCHKVLLRSSPSFCQNALNHLAARMPVPRTATGVTTSWRNRSSDTPSPMHPACGLMQVIHGGCGNHQVRHAGGLGPWNDEDAYKPNISRKWLMTGMKYLHNTANLQQPINLSSSSRQLMHAFRQASMLCSLFEPAPTMIWLPGMASVMICKPAHAGPNKQACTVVHFKIGNCSRGGHRGQQYHPSLMSPPIGTN